MFVVPSHEHSLEELFVASTHDLEVAEVEEAEPHFPKMHITRHKSPVVSLMWLTSSLICGSGGCGGAKPPHVSCD